MVLKRNILSALFFLFYILSVHSVDYGDYGSCFEPFDVSCIKFSNENIIVALNSSFNFRKRFESALQNVG